MLSSSRTVNENVPLADSMEMNVWETPTLSKENTEQQDNTDKALEMEKDQADIESEDIFESCLNSAEKETGKENLREENLDTTESDPAGVPWEKQPEGPEGGGPSRSSLEYGEGDRRSAASPR